MHLRSKKISAVTPDKATVDDICVKLGLNRKLVELLIMRGYDNLDTINVFLNPDENNFYPPEQMLGMKECCERISAAIENDERVVIYGDYDADGICASSILSLYLSSRGLNVHTHIPDRVGEGYGLSVDSIERIIDDIMPDLIVTCDCGISAINEVEHCKDLGVDIIVTDHHEVGSVRPDCVIVNPHQPDCGYPFKDLCGAGVALKIVQALGGIEAARAFYDLAAIATVADLVSLTDENRLIVQLGLKSISNSKNFGVIALTDALKLKTVTSGDIAFKIGPRINAAGRMGSAYRAFELFTSSDPLVVNDRLKQILDDNEERKLLCDELYDEALKILHGEDLINNRAIIITSDKWEKGITGILAARLVGDFKRPVFILVKNNEEYKGTCRSIEGINLYDLLSKNSDLLKEFGGHNQAAGFTIPAENIEKFKSRIYALLDKEDLSMFIPALNYDMELKEEEITNEFALSLDMLEPTGNNGNPKPVFMTVTHSLTATPLKSNMAHTILKTPHGTNLFAYNSYTLNSYYNGATERELLYELSEGDYSPRIYLRGCAVDRLAVNDSLAKAGYLKLLNYQNSDEPVYKTYDDDELCDIVDNPFGILLIAGCKDTYSKYADMDLPNVVLHEFFAETTPNVYTRLMVSPEFGKTFMLENYNKVVFLDSPPSDAVICYLNRRSNATVYIPKVDNRPTVFSSVSSDRQVFGKYFNAVKAHANIKAPNVFSYFKSLVQKDKSLNLPQFIACLSVFTELKLLTFVPNVGIKTGSVKTELDKSSVYKVIEGWQK